MNAWPKEGIVRLIVGFSLNIPLWFVFRKLAVFSSLEMEFRFALLGGFLATAALVFVTPIFWKGKPWHAPIALILMCLPVFVLWQVAQIAIQYR